MSVYILWHRDDTNEQVQRVIALKELLQQENILVRETVDSLEVAAKDIQASTVSIIFISLSLVQDTHFDKASDTYYEIVHFLGDSISKTKPVLLLNNDTRTFETNSWVESVLGFHFGTRLYVNAHTLYLVKEKAFHEVLESLGLSTISEAQQ